MKQWKITALLATTASISVASGPSGGGRENLGLYGGTVMATAWDDASKRLFASVAGPLSLFASDDTGRTWSAAYPTDSLKWMEGSDTRGWAGRGMNVWSNHGTTICRSVEEGGVLWALTLSTDGRNFRTIWDDVLVRRYRDAYRSTNPGKDIFLGTINTATIAQDKIFVGAGGAILSTKDTARTWKLLSFPDSTGTKEQDPQKKWSVQHVQPAGTGRLLVVATAPGGAGGATVNGLGKLWQSTDSGKTFSLAPIFDSLKGDTIRPEHISHLRRLPASPDTILLVNAPPQDLTNSGSAPKAALFLSADSGTTWTRILRDTGVPGPNKVDVGAIRVFQDSALPGPRGIRFVSGTWFSDDLGANWNRIAAANGEIGQITSITGHVPHSGIWLAGSDLGPKRSFDGIDGAGGYALGTEGMTSLTIYRVAQLNSDLNRVYLATNTGLAYTNAYRDTTVAGADKWKAPHGQFPVVFDLSGAVVDVAINPWDTSMLVAATGNGLWRTTNGGHNKADWTQKSFNSIPGWHNACWVRDLRWYSKDTIYAATKADQSTDGGLLASYDAGATWSTVTGIGNRPVSSVSVADNGTAKVIYVSTGKSTVPGWIFRSSNGGATWDSIKGLDANNNPGRKQLPVRDVEPKPGSVDTIFIACGDNTDWAVGWSYNRGDSILVPGQRMGGAEISRIAVNKDHPDSVFFAMRNAIVLLDLSSPPPPPDSTKPSTETVNFMMNWFTGYPGEILYDIHYDELMMASSVGAFGVRGQIPSQVSVKPRATTLDGLHVLANDRTVRLTIPNPTGREMRVEVYDLRGHKLFQGLANAPVRGASEIAISRAKMGRGSFIVRAATNFAQTNRLISLP